MNNWFHVFVKYLQSYMQKKVKGGSETKHLLGFLLATFNWSSTYSSHPALFMIELLLVL